MPKIIELQRFFLSSSDDIVSDGLHSHILQFLWEKYVSLQVTKNNGGGPVLSCPSSQFEDFSRKKNGFLT